MARRAGKAASRKARQRKVHRSIGAASAAPVSAPGPSVDSPPSSAAPPPPPRRAAVAGSTSASQLSASERSEYHYVERDLRDIAILTAVMAALLFVAWLAFSATGLIAA